MVELANGFTFTIIKTKVQKLMLAIYLVIKTAVLSGASIGCIYSLDWITGLTFDPKNGTKLMADKFSILVGLV
jgi:hypothetical protein